MSKLDQLSICVGHAQILRANFREDVDVAASHVIRLWIERNLRWYWMTHDPSETHDPLDEREAMDWLAQNCVKVAHACPACHDINSALLMQQAQEAARRTLISAYPHWDVGGDVKRIYGANAVATLYLSSLTPEPLSIEERARKVALEAWWN